MFERVKLIQINDHIFGDIYFDQVYLHPDDRELAQEYMKMPEFQKAVAGSGKKIPQFLPVHNGDVFDLGGLELEVFHVPGHTPGGICLLDRKDRILFTGDSIIEQTWMQLEESLPMADFLKALEALEPIRSEFDYILTGHTREHLEAGSLYEAHKQAVREVFSGVNENDTVLPYFFRIHFLQKFCKKFHENQINVVLSPYGGYVDMLVCDRDAGNGVG